MWLLQLTILLSIMFVHAATWRDILRVEPLSYVVLSTLILLLWSYKHYVSTHTLILLSLLYPWSDGYWQLIIVLLLVRHIVMPVWLYQCGTIVWSTLVVHKLMLMLYGETLWLAIIAYALFIVSYNLVRGIPNIFSDSLDNKVTLSVLLGSMNSMRYAMVSSVVSVIVLSLYANPFISFAWSYPALLLYMFHQRKFEVLRYEWQYLFFMCTLTLCVTLAGKPW